jgi:hypothetical protein
MADFELVSLGNG